MDSTLIGTERIPDYQSLMLPLLRLAADREEHTSAESYLRLGDEFKLSDAERSALLPSGKQPIFENRIGWAKTYLTKAGLLESPRRGSFRITQRGLDALTANPPRIDNRFLTKFPEFQDFRPPLSDGIHGPLQAEMSIVQDLSPEEQLERSYATLRQQLAADVLSRVRSLSDAAFEKLVIELLVKMGYGGDRTDAARVKGGTGDGGIDGIIEQDRLGLDVVYVQAKRWKNDVGSPEIRDFAGALGENKASKGIIITTAKFSPAAVKSADKAEKRIIRIDGERLANLMIDYNLGVSVESNYVVKKLDTDFFAPE